MMGDKEASLANLIKGLERTGTACQRLALALKNYKKATLKEVSPFALEGFLKEAIQQYKRAQNLTSILEESQNFLNQVQGEIAGQKEAYKTRLGSMLAAELPEIKIVGQLPRLKVGLFTLEFLLAKNEVKIWYGPQYELVQKVNLTKADLASTLKELHKKLDSEGQKGEVLVSSLWQAYKRILAERELNLGTPVSIKDIFPYLIWLQQKDDFWLHPKRNRFKEYSRMQLSFDLFRTPQRTYKDYEFRLIIASREQTRNKADFLWVPVNWQGEGYCFAAISFKKINNLK
ncbi:MAG: hypothetical protein J7M03_01585 [Candidatus Desulfofervidaceae bacterium]|nr:hypothetical protein [Candidatus Desulfofervidaceae bacterium]